MAKPVVVPLAVSLLLHVAIVVLLVLNLTFSSASRVLPQPKIIEAKLIRMEQIEAAKAESKPIEAPAAKPAESPPPELAKPEPIKPEPAQPDVAKQKLEKQKLLEQEKAKTALLAEQKKVAEQKQQEAERQRKAAEEAQRKKAQEELARKQRQQQEKADLARAMAAEDKAMAAARDQEAAASYGNMIQRDIQNNWSRPPNARRGMQTTLLIQLIPSGDVINVSVIDSSGNAAFDRSAEDAVRRVGKFPYLKELSDKSPEVFEQNFRRLRLIFKPEDLRQ